MTKAQQISRKPYLVIYICSQIPVSTVTEVKQETDMGNISAYCYIKREQKTFTSKRNAATSYVGGTWKLLSVKITYSCLSQGFCGQLPSFCWFDLLPNSASAIISHCIQWSWSHGWCQRVHMWYIYWHTFQLMHM